MSTTTPWFRFPWAPFDLESTGKDRETDHVVTGTVARLTEDTEALVTNFLAAVEIDIHPEATEIHGITTEHARANGKPPAEVLDGIAAALVDAMAADVPVVGMNLSFDFTMLDRNLRRYGLATLEQRLGRGIGPVIDVSVLDKRIDQFRPRKRKLINLCEHYAVRIDGAHDAEFDAMAAARVAFRIGQRAQMSLPTLCQVYATRKYPANHARLTMGLAQLDAWQLHELQIGWYAEQVTGLAAHWRKQALDIEEDTSRNDPDAMDAARAEAEELRERADGVTTGWPIVPFAGEVLDA